MSFPLSSPILHKPSGNVTYSQEIAAAKAVGAMTPATGGDNLMNVKITCKDLQCKMLC